MIQVFIANTDGSHDLFATATDLNTNPPSVVANNQRINKGNSIPVMVQEDGSGNCLLDIQAQNADDPTNIKNFPRQSTSAGGTINVDVF